MLITVPDEVFILFIHNTLDATASQGGFQSRKTLWHFQKQSRNSQGTGFAKVTRICDIWEKKDYEPV